MPTITANKARELREAVFKVLPGVSQMQPLVFRDGRLVATATPSAGESAVYGGYDIDGKFVGYAIPGAGPGFQDTIGLLYGFDALRRQVLGMEVLESRETPGLGDKIYKDLEFVGNFRRAVGRADNRGGQERQQDPAERGRRHYRRDHFVQGGCPHHQRNARCLVGQAGGAGIRTAVRA